MGLIFCITLYHDEIFLSSISPLIGMHSTGPHELDRIWIVHALLTGEHLSASKPRVCIEKKKKKRVNILIISYLLEPRFQNIVPNINAVKAVNESLTALYAGFRQYDRFCFQRQAKNCVKNDCGYWVWK